MSYESPIEIAEKMSNQLEQDIMEVVHSYGIKVNKDELIKALAYDRGQYEKGYVDGQKSVEPKNGKWINTAWRIIYKCSECGNYLDFNGVNAGRGDANFCPNCGAKMEW